MKWLKKWFVPVDTFSKDEWIRKEQSTAMLTFAFFFGLGVLPFAYVRWMEGNHLVAVSQMILGIFLVGGSWKLRRDKVFYDTFSLFFFLFFLAYTFIIFFNVPSNHLNILWVVVVPIFIFFFLDRKAGNLIFGFISVFIVYLIMTKYPYSIAEYVTLIAAFLSTTFVMYVYEEVKEAERIRVFNYTQSLHNEIEHHTAELKQWNEKLEQRVELELKRRVEQEQMLLHQYKLASLGEMIDTIAHQWRQPLMSVNALLLNLDRGIDTDRHGVYLKGKVDAIAELTDHMSQTITDFRILLSPDKVSKEFNVHTAIEQVLKLMKERLEHIDVRDSIERDIFWHGYPNEISQWLMIILTNAIEAFTDRDVMFPYIDIQIYIQNGLLHIKVEDNGGGLEPETAQKIFDPYFTTKKKKGGSGLGLYIARIIVERNMLGKLELEHLNDGICFTLIVPKI